MDKYDAFISFSFKDQDIVENVVNELVNKYGISCWTCLEYVKSGQSYKELIPNAIKNSYVTVVFISKDSVVSTEVPKEVGIALKREKTVVPFLLDNSEYQGSLEYDLQNVNYIDATVPFFEERIKDLAKAICFAANKPFCTDNALDNQQTKSFSTASINNTVKHSASYKTAAEMQTAYARANVGDTIIFGSYEQDSEKWEHKEPIEWLVLAREEDRMLVISKYCLDYMSYFACGGSWQNTTVRKWLNKTFFNYAFSYEEQKIIEKIKLGMQETMFKNTKEKGFSLNNDQIFLLSEEEVSECFINTYLSKAKPTTYAKKIRENFLRALGEKDDENCRWSLRTQIETDKSIKDFILTERSCGREFEKKGTHIEYVNEDGLTFAEYSFLNKHKHGLGIRPALWIDLKHQK